MNILTGLLKTKVFAIILGAFGLGIASQIFTVNSFILFLGTVGLPMGLTKYISEWEAQNKWDDIYGILNQALALVLIFSLCLLALALIYSREISSILLDSDKYSFMIIMTSLSFPFTAIVTVLDAFLKGLKDFGKYVKLTMLSSIAVLTITIASVAYWGLEGVAISLFAGSLSSAILYIVYLKRASVISFARLLKIKIKLDNAFKNILKFGIVSLMIGISDYLALLIIRTYVVKTLGVEANGIYQSVNTISSNYFNVFFMSIGIYLIPVLSSMKLHEINNEINSTYKLTLLLIVPIISITFVLRYVILLVLYSSNFYSAAELFVYNFTGDFFKALSWVLAAWLIPAARIKIWLFYGVIYNLNYLFVFFICIVLLNLNLKSIVIGYAFTNVVHFLINLHYLRKHNSFRFNKTNNKLFVYSIIALSFVLVLSSFDVNLGYLVVLPILTVWMKLSVKKEEMSKVYHLFRSGLQAKTKSS
ncbi:MAG: oligosaccharide flippase family protein [Ignavibacteria bacterium]|nr:oligosaccharide flippase family protein [Ignavibacteria bacterium]